MPKTDHDTALMRPSDVALALALLTRLPVPVPQTDRAAARAAWAYPLAGLAPAALAALCGLLAMTLGLSPELAAGLALVTAIMTTGALHEDGLADCADGFWGGWTAERRLEIMRDSRIGTYGVLALIVSFGLRWVVLSALFELDLAAPALLAAGALSRGALPALMAAVPHARQDGLSHRVGRVPTATAILSAAVAALIAIFALGTGAAALILLTCLVVLGIGAFAKARIGGQTGDVLGAVQQIVEITVLIAILI